MRCLRHAKPHGCGHDGSLEAFRVARPEAVDFSNVLNLVCQDRIYNYAFVLSVLICVAALPVLRHAMAVMPATSMVATQPAVTIRERSGAATFFIDGHPEPPIFIYQTRLTDKEPAQFRAQGYRLFSFVGDWNGFGMAMGDASPTATTDTEYDTALKEFTERVPDGLCILRVRVGARAGGWRNIRPRRCDLRAAPVGKTTNMAGRCTSHSHRRRGGARAARLCSDSCGISSIRRTHLMSSACILRMA